MGRIADIFRRKLPTLRAPKGKGRYKRVKLETEQGTEEWRTLPRGERRKRYAKYAAAGITLTAVGIAGGIVTAKVAPMPGGLAGTAVRAVAPPPKEGEKAPAEAQTGPKSIAGKAAEQIKSSHQTHRTAIESN